MHKAIASSLPTFTYSQTLSKNLYYIGGYGIPELHPYFSQPLNRSKSEPDFIPLFEVKARLINFENQYNKFLAIAFS